MIKHAVGDKLYIPSAYHLSRGSDDVEGGLATIDGFEFSKTLPKDHRNYTFVSFKEHPNRGLNYQYVLENQEKWAVEYKDKIAHPCPDIDTPFIQDGDIVNGQVWKGGDIW